MHIIRSCVERVAPESLSYPAWLATIWLDDGRIFRAYMGFGGRPDDPPDLSDIAATINAFGWAGWVELPQGAAAPTV